VSLARGVAASARFAGGNTSRVNYASNVSVSQHMVVLISSERGLSQCVVRRALGSAAEDVHKRSAGSQVRISPRSWRDTLWMIYPGFESITALGVALCSWCLGFLLFLGAEDLRKLPTGCQALHHIILMLPMWLK
jgi:hypothetical protein